MRNLTRAHDRRVSSLLHAAVGCSARRRSAGGRAARSGRCGDAVRALHQAARRRQRAGSGWHDGAALGGAGRRRGDGRRCCCAPAHSADAANRYGVTPLLAGRGNGNAAIVDALLEGRGATPTPGPGRARRALMTAARAGQRRRRCSCCSTRGADVDAKERWYGQTALMWAAAENHARGRDRR